MKIFHLSIPSFAVALFVVKSSDAFNAASAKKDAAGAKSAPLGMNRFKHDNEAADAWLNPELITQESWWETGSIPVSEWYNSKRNVNPSPEVRFKARAGADAMQRLALEWAETNRDKDTAPPRMPVIGSLAPRLPPRPPAWRPASSVSRLVSQRPASKPAQPKPSPDAAASMMTKALSKAELAKEWADINKEWASLIRGWAVDKVEAKVEDFDRAGGQRQLHAGPNASQQLTQQQLMSNLAKEWAARNRDSDSVYLPKNAVNKPAAPVPAPMNSAQNFMSDLAREWSARNRDSDSAPSPSPMRAPAPFPRAPAPSANNAMSSLAREWAARNRDADSSPPAPSPRMSAGPAFPSAVGSTSLRMMSNTHAMQDIRGETAANDGTGLPPQWKDRTSMFNPTFVNGRFLEVAHAEEGVNGYNKNGKNKNDGASLESALLEKAIVHALDDRSSLSFRDSNKIRECIEMIELLEDTWEAMATSKIYDVAGIVH